MCIRDRIHAARLMVLDAAARIARDGQQAAREEIAYIKVFVANTLQRCLLYTSDAADERSSVDLGGRRIIKKKKNAREPNHLRHI